VNRTKLTNATRWVAWGALLIAIPVTSFPFVPEFMARGETVVRPLSLFPLAVLVLLDLIPYLIRGGTLPKLTLPILAFCVLAALTTFLQLFEPAFPFRGQVAEPRAMRSLATLAIGISFYLVTIRMTSTKPGLRLTLKLVYVAMAIAIAWGLLQALRLLVDWPSYGALYDIQKYLSIRTLHEHRVTGFAFEPSWFADQLAVMALPLFWAGMLTGFHVFGSGRLARLIDWVLLLVAGLVLFMTFSRGGLASFFVGAMIATIYWMIVQRRLIFEWVANISISRATRVEFIAGGVLRIVIFTVILLGFAAILARAVQDYEYFTLLWRRIGRLDNLGSYLIAIGSGPRLALAQAGWALFLENPWLGVGLGQSGFYLLDYIPNWAYDRPSEILLMLKPDGHLFPNIKNLWVRLLAETGIVGLASFVIYLSVLFLAAVNLIHSRKRMYQYLGLVGMISLVALILEGMSLDSFALPVMWVMTGLVTGAYVLMVREENVSRIPSVDHA